jgi:hypothetical protein
MIDKGNPDCFKELVRLARLLGVDFDTMTNGSKQEMPLHFTDGTETTIKFYVVTGKNGRKDKRYNIPAPVLREQAAEGDTVAFTFKHDAAGNVMLCANVTRNPGVCPFDHRRDQRHFFAGGGVMAIKTTKVVNAAYSFAFRGLHTNT